MISAVRPAEHRAQGVWTSRSAGMSSSAVASSRTSTAGAAMNARANEISCRCPADSLPPRLPTAVVVSLGQRRDERRARRSPGPPLRLPRRPSRGPPEPDVVRDRPLEEVRLLGDHARSRAEHRIGQLAQVHPVEGDPARARVVEPGRAAARSSSCPPPSRRPGPPSARAGCRGRAQAARALPGSRTSPTRTAPAAPRSRGLPGHRSRVQRGQFLRVGGSAPRRPARGRRRSSPGPRPPTGRCCRTARRPAADRRTAAGRAGRWPARRP